MPSPLQDLISRSVCCNVLLHPSPVWKIFQLIDALGLDLLRDEFVLAQDLFFY